MISESSKIKFSGAEDPNDIGRHCGSNFASTMVKKLSEVGTTRQQLGPKVDEEGIEMSLSAEQEESIAEFARSIYLTLLADGDRRGYEHGVLQVVKTQALEYLDSFKGNDDTGEDGGLHSSLHSIIEGRETSSSSLESALRALRYRMNLMEMADHYLDLMRIPPPNGLRCHEYDIRKIFDHVGRAEFHDICEMILERDIIFPKPLLDIQGRPFRKPRFYLVAAFHDAKTNRADIVKNLDWLAATLDQQTDLTKEALQRNLQTASKRQKMFRAFGERLRSLSPTKRRSRGQSLAGSPTKRSFSQ